MTDTAATRQGLTDEQLQELLPLLVESDSIELKLTVPDSALRSTVTALGIDPLDAQIRLITFFDTPDLALDRAGVVVRARRIQGKGNDSVVKLRPLVPSSLPRGLRSSASFTVEVDALPGGFVCSGSMKGELSPTDVQSALQGERPLRKLFSKEQRAFFSAHAPDGITLDDLSILGPIFVLKARFTPEGLGRRMVAEVWLYPDGGRIVELSTRCRTTEAFQVAAETRAFLAGRGVDLTAEQQTKTRKALEYFAADLQVGA
ncbi:hypothetical protein ACFCVO_04355 [Agromyces sp. NPDC056379]|uniref:hypothetical protein n=1 Tax=unclassified Agromyces TaxID=2639701 RepID=UPI0035D97A22